MNYKYFHDLQSKIVYRIKDPDIRPKTKRGNLIDWHISTEIDVTRADNVLSGSQWKYATSEYPRENYEPKYSKEDVISYFEHRFYPSNCREISSAEYDILQKQYEIEARNNHPG